MKTQTKTVVFYEKPGCVGNARQKARLESLGYRLDVRDLLREPWTARSLRPFFGSTPVTEWFNTSAVKVKSGEIDPASFDEEEALALLAAEPLLIRRPLLRTEMGCAAGFSPGPRLVAIGIAVPEDGGVGEGCARGTKQSCSSPNVKAP